MLIYLTTSLFDSPAQTLINAVNTAGVMGKGIALVFKQRYPEMYQQYHAMCLAGKLNIGNLYIYRKLSRIIVNFPTKKHWRNPSQIEYIEVGLAEFVRSYSQYGISSVSFPQLDCGHWWAGLGVPGTAGHGALPERFAHSRLYSSLLEFAELYQDVRKIGQLSYHRNRPPRNNPPYRRCGQPGQGRPVWLAGAGIGLARQGG